MFYACLSYSQSQVDTLPDCENGIKDGKEIGVDCGFPCIPCNGEAEIIYNNKKLKTGKILVENSMLKNLTGRVIEKDRINYNFLSFMFSFKNNGTKTSIFINLKYIRFDKMQPKNIYLTGGTDRDFQYADLPPLAGEMYNVHENLVFLTLLKSGGSVSKIKLEDKRKSRYVLEIKQVNSIERFISGNLILYGTTNDGTPIDIIGTFNNVSY